MNKSYGQHIYNILTNVQKSEELLFIVTQPVNNTCSVIPFVYNMVSCRVFFFFFLFLCTNLTLKEFFQIISLINVSTPSNISTTRRDLDHYRPDNGQEFGLPFSHPSSKGLVSSSQRIFRRPLLITVGFRYDVPFVSLI